MKIDLDKTTLTAITQVQARVAEISGVKPRSVSNTAQALLQWICTHLPDSDLKTLAPMTLSLAQRKKIVLSQISALTGQADLPQLDKLMRTINRLKQPCRSDTEKQTEVIK